MRILIACEESQTVAKAFRDKGHQAFSCDLQECSGGYPEWHLRKNVVDVLDDQWDMIIAFPPCTNLTRCSARWLYPRGVVDPERLQKVKQAREFFMLFYDHKCDKICIENPVPLLAAELPKPSQDIQPYWFGHNYSKKTYLWLKGLPILMPTSIDLRFTSWVAEVHSSKDRSKTFEGIARAMADQWV
jgi:hypothetical protein